MGALDFIGGSNIWNDEGESVVLTSGVHGGGVLAMVKTMCDG